MTTSPEGNARLAVLIDADNADSSIIEPLLKEVATFGVASAKRIYGDWTDNRLNKWKEKLLAHSIQPMQQFAYTTGKNATDSAMIIDAMDLLYTDTFDGFCIVSSDSDFTRLASRLREAGMRVYGFGEDKTPEPFRKACDQFVRVSIFRNLPEEGDNRATARKSSAELAGDAELVKLFRSAISSASDEDGQANLSAVSNLVRKQSPDFDPRNYGYAKLSDLAEAIGLFSVARKNQNVQISLDRPAKKVAKKAAKKQG